MRRQDIQLLAAARQGSSAALCEVGRRYLRGEQGFPCHPATGLGYLSQRAVRDSPCAVQAIAESLTLLDILSLNQFGALELAATLGCAPAQLKLGAWLMTAPTRREEGLQWLRAASRRGAAAALAALALDRCEVRPAEATAAMLALLSEHHAIDPAPEVLARALRTAHDDHDFDAVGWCLRVAAHWPHAHHDDIAQAVVDTLALADLSGRAIDTMPVEFVTAALEQRCARGDPRALYLFGRALCGIRQGRLDSAALVGATNLRKGTALLLRAADAGEAGAWMHLYRVSADHRCSVANPQMARFFLEKAAAHGDAEAQCKFGALLMREAGSMDVTEQAMHWLHQAGQQGDATARLLLGSLVLPVKGSDAQAAAAAEQVGRTHPWLAARLMLARHFGLTRLEALCVDPIRGARPWGLVVGPNPSIRKVRLAAPRAVPAVAVAARLALRAALSLFVLPDRDGDMRHRTRVARALFLRHGIDESIFFATASSTALDTLRSGPKWAFRHRGLLKTAFLEPDGFHSRAEDPMREPSVARVESIRAPAQRTQPALTGSLI